MNLRNRIIEAIQKGNILRAVNRGELTAVINVAAEELRRGINSDCQVEIIESFVSYLIDEYPMMTDRDLWIIMAYGCIGEWGEYYGVNKKSMVQWVKLYSKVRQKIHDDYEKASDSMGNIEYMKGCSRLIKDAFIEYGCKFPETEAMFTRIYGKREDLILERELEKMRNESTN